MGLRGRVGDVVMVMLIYGVRVEIRRCTALGSLFLLFSVHEIEEDRYANATDHVKPLTGPCILSHSLRPK